MQQELVADKVDKYYTGCTAIIHFRAYLYSLVMSAGNILKIKIDLGDHGLFPSWQLVNITITNDWHISWLFQCNCTIQPSSSKELQATLI